MPNTGDKIIYGWAEEKKGTTFVAVSELMEADGKFIPVKHTLCDGTEVIQRITAPDFKKDNGGWWGFFTAKRDNKTPFVPKGADKPAVEKPAKAAKPSKKAVNEMLEPADAVKPGKRFMNTKNKEPTNVWIPKARYDELLKIEADHKATLNKKPAVDEKLDDDESESESESEAESEAESESEKSEAESEKSEAESEKSEASEGEKSEASESESEASEASEAEETALEAAHARLGGGVEPPRWTYTVTKNGNRWDWYVKDNVKSNDMTDCHSSDRTKKGAITRAKAAIAAFEAKELIKQKKNSVY